MSRATVPAALSGNALDRFIRTVSPGWYLERVRARAIADTLVRHFEAAEGGRRTVGWHRSSADANAAHGPALSLLRVHARDLVRNNGWGRRALRVIGGNTVGWGIMPKAVGPAAEQAMKPWKLWANTPQCDADERLTFAGMQRQAIETVAEAGEVLIRRRRRRMNDGLAIPLQLQVLEPDFLDTTKDGLKGSAGGPIVQGVEFDAIGTRVAYWLFEQHPGSARLMGSGVSKRVPASDIIHLFRADRPGQVRGVSWYAPTIVTLKDFDEYEDATLMRQKIAACFAAFVTDSDGSPALMGAPAEDGDDSIDALEPGQINYLDPGKSVVFATPPGLTDPTFGTWNLRKVAAGIGVTYEDLTGDYSQVNFSSARMARLSHYANVHDWRWNMLIPLFCDRAFAWAMEAAELAGLISERPTAEWTPPPMPMLDPDKEALALMRLVRIGAMTHDEMVRELGYDPEDHWKGYAEGLKRLDALGIVLDSDARKTTQAGNPSVPAGGGGSTPADEEAARLLTQVARTLVGGDENPTPGRDRGTARSPEAGE